MMLVNSDCVTDQQKWILRTADMVGSCSTTSESSLLESATCGSVSPIKVNVMVLPEFKVESNVEVLPELKVNPKPNVEVRVSKTFHKPTTYIVRPVESCIRRHIYYNDAIRFPINNRLSESQLPIDNMEEDSNQLNPTDLIYLGFSRLIRSFRGLRAINPRNHEHHGTWFSDICGRCLKMPNWFPKMCSCLDSRSTATGGRSATRERTYERLSSAPTIFEISRMMQRARRRVTSQSEELEVLDQEKQEELRFYNDDETWTAVVVEKNLRCIDLCELLKVKKNVSGIAWSIVETWPELGFERTLEDHEDILAVHREMETFAPHHERKFYFRQDFLKYEFFIKPKQFFPAEMVAFPNVEDIGTFAEVESALRAYLSRDNGECPQVYSPVWMKDGSSTTWKKLYMLLRDRKLYTMKKNTGAFPKRPTESDLLNPIARLSDYHIYRIPNAKKYFNAPFEWGACLRPSSNAEAEDTETGEHGLKVIAFNSEKARACWLTAMRLAKYGKQLRENYRAFKNKQCEQPSGSPKDQFGNYNVTNESVRSRVAMDFTGSVGRIVEDPKEAKDIAESEGIIWRRRWRPFSRTPSGCAMVRLHGLDGGIHVLQPWFHGGLKRDIAAAIIRDHGSVDGVFLVRESKSNPGAYVLTYKYSDKVFHAQIQPVYDERRNCWLYTLDKGATKFYDLLQLVEFYQLNSGSLPTRLTHYVQTGVPTPIPRPEDGGASPSPADASQRFSVKTESASI